MTTKTQEILDGLREHFNESIFQLIYDDKENQYMVIRKMVITNKKTKQVEEREIHCLEFVINDTSKEVIIKLILNCSIDIEFIGRGKDIVERIVKFSKEIGYSTRIEYDVSKISVHGVEFSLRKIKILSAGKTWYQSLGFYEDNYVSNRECILNFIEKYSSKLKMTIREYYAEKMVYIQSLSKKVTLSGEELDSLTKLSKNIDRKFRELEKECPSTYENFHDLIYQENEPVKEQEQQQQEIPSQKDQTKKISPKTTKKRKTISKSPTIAKSNKSKSKRNKI